MATFFSIFYESQIFKLPFTTALQDYPRTAQVRIILNFVTEAEILMFPRCVTPKKKRTKS